MNSANLLIPSGEVRTVSAEVGIASEVLRMLSAERTKAFEEVWTASAEVAMASEIFRMPFAERAVASELLRTLSARNAIVISVSSDAAG